MFILDNRWVQLFLARAYAQARWNDPLAGEDYWRNKAASNAGAVIFLGPLTAWIPYAVASMPHPGWTPARAALLVFVAMATALLLGILASRRTAWRQLVQHKPDDDFALFSITKVVIGFCWIVINPAICYSVFGYLT